MSDGWKMLQAEISRQSLKWGPSAGATDIEMRGLENQLQLALPDDLRKLLSNYNGDSYDKQPVLGGCKYLLSVNDIASDYVQLNETAEISGGLDRATESMKSDAAVSPYMWSRYWIPFLLDNDIYYAVDTTLGGPGQHGQIILIIWENDHVYKVADDLNEFLVQCLKEKLRESD